MSNLSEIRAWLKTVPIDGLLIPSKDTFLSEFAPPGERFLQWAMGFSGSTGLAFVTSSAAALFVDGRYLEQALQQLANTPTSIFRPAQIRDWLKGEGSALERIGYDPWRHSASEATQLRSLARELGLELVEVDLNALGVLWHDRPQSFQPPVEERPAKLCGMTRDRKLQKLRTHMDERRLVAFLVADPEDLSWLLNVRVPSSFIDTEVGSWHLVPCCRARALVTSGSCYLWTDGTSSSWQLLQDIGAVCLCTEEMFSHALMDAAQAGAVSANLDRTPSALLDLIGSAFVADDHVTRNRWRKTRAEIDGAVIAHRRDAVAAIHFLERLTRDTLPQSFTEFDAAEMLEQERRKDPSYLAPSMPMMSASGPNGALPHYVPQKAGARALAEHPLYWVDSGGHFDTGTTDNTMAFALARPDCRHIRAHTTVLRALLALAMARFPKGTTGVQLDVIARQQLWCDGLDFEHSTGHGVGSYLNIHEGPLIGPNIGVASTVPIESGMIVSNEPAFYARLDFGVRIESHMVVVESADGFLGFDTISRLPIDPNLVDFARLSPAEKDWLCRYHRKILDEIGPLLSEPAHAWVSVLAAAFEQPSSPQTSATTDSEKHS